MIQQPKTQVSIESLMNGTQADFEANQATYYKLVAEAQKGITGQAPDSKPGVMNETAKRVLDAVQPL